MADALLTIPTSNEFPTASEGERWQNAPDALRDLLPDWDGYSAPVPTMAALQSARQVLDAMVANGLSPTRLAPSVVGGVGLTHREGERKLYVEARNDGRVYALTSGRGEPSSFAVSLDAEGLEKLIETARAYLHG